MESPFNEVSPGRRSVLRHGGSVTVLGLLVSAGLIRPADLHAAWNPAAFDTRDLPALMKALGGAAPVQSQSITLTVPEVAENGAVVPVTVSTTIDKPEEIAILVEKNPTLLAAQFDIAAMGTASISTRIKMAQSSNVHALVRAGGRYFHTTREVVVTLGGCG